MLDIKIDRPIDPLIQEIHSGNRVACAPASGAERAYAAAGLALEVKKPVFMVLPTRRQCEAMAFDLQFFLAGGEREVCIFPPYNILPFKQVSYHSDTAAKRINILYRLASNSADSSIFLLPAETLLQRLIPISIINDYAELLIAGEDIDRDELVSHLHAGGYTHTALVEEPGEYSIRGGIIDVYSPMYEQPLRIELFGDTVDSMRFFSPVSQRKTGNLYEAVILPAREAVVKKHWLDGIVRRARECAGQFGLSEEKAERFISRINSEGVFSGLESLLPLIYSGLDTIFDYAPAHALWIQCDPGEIEKEAVNAEKAAAENYQQASSANRLCIDPEKLYERWSSAKSMLEEKVRISFRPYPLKKPESGNESCISLDVSDNSDLASRLGSCGRDSSALQPLAEWIEEHRSAGLAVLLVCRTESQARRIKELMENYGLSAEMRLEIDPSRMRRGKACICIGQLSAGFVWPGAGLAIAVEDEVFGGRFRARRRSGRRRREKIQTELLDFGELNIDDLVVHVEHGIGVYKGLVKLSVDGVTSDFLEIEYKGGDKLYLPVDRMDMVQKYMGVEGIEPVIDKLGGKSWQRSRARAKESAEKIANELLELYASRRVSSGHAFSSPDSWYKDFEAGFPYEETSDQLKAIDDVLSDMEQAAPMDRLICGDVGYGKTEVALRAAFKAVNDGKQAALLVPTTLLAEQHYSTFSERFSRYPVNIECLSRFRSRKTQGRILSDLRKGAADIVIGTHRLLQKDVQFKDLGLVIIDEEQRFGVKHKEKLKKLRSTVDVLSMTATPIPRTLHMSLMGVRDISVIQTPPELRQPIVSYISDFDPMIIKEAVRKELGRGGQIFFVHNNINTIRNMAGYLRDLVPEARLATAHGRMEEKALENSMYQFINREIDMLVCTTIVESGLDIPNANTMIINRADRYGLAQIYQLRGRIGRSNEQAYAYLFVPKEAALTKDAQKRLKVLMEHSDLGSGFQIAMNDLKIRGGGSALGVAQSGHIAAVGYDMFLKLLEESVSGLKGERVTEKLDPEINVPMSVYIPETYIQDIQQRMSIYRRMARMTELSEIADMKSELTDRYGPLPEPAQNLLMKIMLRILSIKAGVKRLDLTGEIMVLSFSEAHQQRPFGVIELIDRSPEHFLFTPENNLKVYMSGGNLQNLMAQAKKTLMDIAKSVNN